MSERAWKAPVGTARVSARATRYVAEVLASGWLSAGTFTARLERLMAEAHGVRVALFCNSGTSALQCAIAALKELDGWADGDEIIVPAVTFVASASMVLANRLRPVFADVDPRTYNLDPAAAARAGTPRTRAVMPCHLFGQPCEMDPLLELAGARGWRVIEDSCDTMFATYRGRPVGGFGDVACFSTRASHIVSTGIGGFACTGDAEIARVVRSLFNDGRADPGSAATARDVVGRFRFERVGFNHRATEMEAALGVAQLEERAERLAAHRRNARWLSARLAGYADLLQLPWWPAHVEHAFSAYPLVLRGAVHRRDDLMVFLAARGVESRALFPLISQPVVRALCGDLAPALPVAHRLDERGFYLGCHEDLDEEALEVAAATVIAYLESTGA